MPTAEQKSLRLYLGQTEHHLAHSAVTVKQSVLTARSYILSLPPNML